MADGIKNLQKALVAAAGGDAFALDSSYLTASLNDDAVKVPADYDSWIAAAFFTASATDFLITIPTAGDVGEVGDDNSFTVTNANVPFITSGAPLSSNATMVFGDKDGSLVVQIQSSPANWTWTSSFEFMNGWPFSQFEVLKDVLFAFSTVDGKFPYTGDDGMDVKGGSFQSFASKIPLPDAAKPFLVLFDGLKAPTGDLLLSGSLDMASYNAETVLFPTGTLSASIEGGEFDILYLKVTDPSVTITLPPPDGSDETGDFDIALIEDDEEAGDQSPLLSISSGIAIGKVDSGADYTLQVQILQGEDDEEYAIDLVATKDGTPLSPSTIIELVGGTGSYFSATPAVLQQFLTFVTLKGLSISGPLPDSGSDKAVVNAVAVQIGSSEGTSWTIIPDPTGTLDFTIQSFDLQWSVQNPFEPETRVYSYDFTTSFTLATSVFKGPGGEGDGLFTVQFTSESIFYASFDGTAKLSDFLTTLSGGIITLNVDNIGDFELSDISLTVNYNAQSFNFSSGFALDLNLLKIDDKPILSISDGTIAVAAKTPTQKEDGGNATSLLRGTPAGVADPNAEKNTQWQASIMGGFAVGPLSASASIAYDGFASPKQWNLSASLAQPLDVSDLIDQFFNVLAPYPFPNFFPGDLQLLTFDINAVIPAEKGELQTSYDINTSFSWYFTLVDQKVGIDPARLGIVYDGSKPKGTQFSGFAEGTWVYPAINLRLTMGYEFKPAVKGQGGNDVLYVEWEGFRAEWQEGKNQLVFSLKGWSIGSLIQALVRTLGNPYFTLSAPWDFLNQISLDGLRVNVLLQNGLSFSQRISASYELSSPINLGFINITAIKFYRDTSGKVTIGIEGSSPIADSSPAFKNLMDPDKGQDVNKLPTVPGQGEQWFKLFLLVLGQRIGITGYADFKNTKEVICALSNVPNTSGDTNPVDPNADKGPTKGLPYYDQSNNWLIAGHFGLLKVGDTWSIDAMMVFNDPNLYGLRLALAGDKMGGLANLVIDILYKKITDDIGVYQIEFTFPDIIRNLNFGAVSITLPQLGIKIYTNGDFFIDIGFPYNLDFRRSFSISVIVYGVPVLGSGGFYFGKLSNATSTTTPKTDLGTFDPVIEFGVGLQLGLGYNFEKGPLKAGFALTVFGIIEGTIAPWHPYDESSRALALAASGGALQSDYYFKVKGTVGIIGLLYGSVDFAIISASLNVKIVLSISITYEAYREIPLTATASVEVSLKVKINLGLFSISISLSFSATVSAEFKIGANERAPWDQIGGAQDLLFQSRPQSYGPDATVLMARQVFPRPKRVGAPCLRSMGLMREDTKPTLTMMAGAQYTVLAPEGSKDASTNQGAFVLLLAMDAPDPTGQSTTANTSFDQLSQAYFPWVIDTMAVETGEVADLVATLASTVTLSQLNKWITRLADSENKVFDIASLLTFLGDTFTLNIENPATAQSSGLKEKLTKGSVIFPAFDGLTMAVPDPAGGTDTKPVAFETYTTATAEYARQISKLFDEVAARIEAENQEDPVSLADDDATPESMAALVFVDAFSMIARQLLQAAADALKDYAYPLTADTKLSVLLSDLNAITGNALTTADIAVPNAKHPLTAAKTITIPAQDSVIQTGDTLNTIAVRNSDAGSPARWTTTAENLILSNSKAHFIQGGIELSLVWGSGETKIYVTVTGDSFQTIALEIGTTVEALAAQSVLYDTANLLMPTQTMLVPEIAYTTAGTSGASSDTLNSVAASFNTTATAVTDRNLDVEALFAVDAEGGMLALANLQALQVSKLWDAIAATNQVGQTAGMVSRFLLYGLRLPVADGLTLSADFLYPTGQDYYGVYQLTGQQFPTPVSATGYIVDLARGAQSHGVPLDFIEFNGVSTTDPMPLTLSEAYAQLEVVVEWAKVQGNFNPNPSLTVLPLTERSARVFSASGFARWSSSSVEKIQAVTTRSAGATGTGLAEQSSDSQIQPTIWALPPALTNLAAARQASIEAATGSISSTYPLLPQFSPEVLRTDPATNATSSTPLNNWAWSTRIDFQVKRLPAAALVAKQGMNPGDVPGPAIAPSLPFVYELVGPTAADSILLEQILTAMDTLGEDIASSIFLLYNQNGPGVPTLVTPGDEDFLSFITQTNLSTETNPAGFISAQAKLGVDAEPPRGIANPPAQFIRLMWELSTVRSGGYFLYYEMTRNKQGLPSAIFDSSGTGTLSMVVSFAAKGPGTFGMTTPNFVNSVVTTDALDTERDVVQAVSQSASGASAPVPAGITLDALSDMYGPGPGRIAEVNPDAAVPQGVDLPMAGIVHQLVEADLVRDGGAIDAAKTLDKLAAHFSAGATSTFTGQAIADFNPGVTVALAAVFYIPDFTYKVDTAAAPGNTFPSMAAYYGVTVDQVVRGVSAVPDIFSESQTITINSQVFELRQQLPPRNIGIAMKRANLGEPTDLPPNPTPEQKATFANQTMSGLYTSLSAGLQQNVYFKTSAMGTPFGPQNHDDAGDDSATVAESRLRRVDRRHSRLAALALADYDYRQSIGIGDGLALVNAAPETVDPTLPAKSENPYVGVGSTAQVSLRWQDVFGNTTVTPFTAPAESYGGALNGAAVPVLFNDRLMGMGEWPNTRASYIYDNTSGPSLNLGLELNTLAYEGESGQKQAAHDLKLYQRVYFQLNQTYGSDLPVKIPGVSGNAVTMSLSNSLFADPVTDLGNDADNVRAYVADCVSYLYSVANPAGSSSLPPQPTASVSLPVDVNAIADGNIIELDVALSFHRNPLLTEPSVAALQNGLSVSSAVLPQADSDAGVAFTKFAMALETLFDTNDWMLKTGEGLAKTTDDSAEGDQQLWAVRFGKSAGKGIHFNIGDTASYYAPKPVAKALESKIVEITDYSTGEETAVNFDGVDLNQWFQAMLDALDLILSADYAPHIFILDEIDGFDDPMSPPTGAGDPGPSLHSILNTKEQLADNISSTVLPVLSTSATDSSTKAAAGEKLRQQLLNQIGAAYRAGVTIVFGLSDVSGDSGDGPAGPDSLYGQPGGEISGTPLNQNYSLTPARIPLGPSKDGQETVDPRLAFVFGSKTVLNTAYVPLDMSLKISHLEFDRSNVPGIEGYVESRWLSFVNGPLPYDLGADTSNVPVVNRNLPTPPTVSGQTAQSTWQAVHPITIPPTDPADLSKWNYSFTYLYQQGASDAVSYRIELNSSEGSNQALDKAVQVADLFSTLAQFISSWPAILADMNKYLVQINGQDDQPPATLEGARKAVEAFATQTAAVSEAYANTLRRQSLMENAAPETVVINFMSVLDATPEGHAQTNIRGLEIDGTEATWEPITNTISNGTTTLPAMVIAIQPETYTATAVPQDKLPAGVELAYVYETTTPPPGEDPGYLSYSDALGDSTRIVAMDKLDVLAYQNGWSTLFVQRNLILFPIEDIDTISTNPDFLFQTPEVRFANPIVPSLIYPDFSLNGMPGAQGDLDALLTAFFKGLYAGGSGKTNADVSMQASYSYQMVPGQDDIPRVAVPVSLLVPSPSSVDPSVVPGFVAPFAATVQNWIAKNNPTVKGDAQVDIELKVFGASTAKQPLIEVKKLFQSIPES